MDDHDALAEAAPDVTLVTALAVDLDGTFEAVVVAHQDRLYTIALRMLGDPGEAEEAAQDAFVRAYRALAGYDEARIRTLKLRGWLTTICLNRCRSALARRATRPPRPTALEALVELGREPSAPGETGPAAHAERRAEGEAWARRLAALPVPYRAAVVLRHVDGLSYPEVAAALGRPEGTVKAQVHRGIALLRTMLETERHPELQEMTA
jgi:RNA polymerase sigma-70 factor (ECF subfamily)